ncbi:MAG: NAD-dependent epimerase/dehydratase family protein [Nitrospirae bacterium]|nr:NAD-dependent epimerase/dehydratase family protein [Nitrospirota bacterium]
MDPRDLLIVGCGFSGRAIARAAVGMGWRVTGTCAAPGHAPAVAASGALPHALELGAALADADGRRALAGLIAAHRFVVLAVGPNRVPGTERFVDYTERLVPPLLASGRLEAVVYLSSTGIYGNRGGAWVDEATPPGLDVGPRGVARQEAERALLEAARFQRLPVRILRLAGIYGPGRHIGLRIRAGDYRVIEADPPLVVNRIHVDDLAQAALAALGGGAPGEVYVVADGVPATLREVADHAAALMGLPAPPGEPAEVARTRMGEANFHLVADRKRCRNRKLIEELGVTLAYPSYREGLRQALAADGLLASQGL